MIWYIIDNNLWSNTYMHVFGEPYDNDNDNDNESNFIAMN